MLTAEAGEKLVFERVEIEGYRGLHRFEMRNLGRVNLLVGRNNSGKTSVLEALHLLNYGWDINALWQLCGRRGERFGEDRDRYGEPEIDISHLFSGHELSIGSRFSITSQNSSAPRTVAFEIVERPKLERGEKISEKDVTDEILRPRYALRIYSAPHSPPRTISLTNRGGVNFEYVDAPRRQTTSVRRDTSRVPTSNFISTNSLSGVELTRLWDKIQLTPMEDLVLDALKFIDPQIEQIRSTGLARLVGDRAGFIIKRLDYRQPFPLGSLGDGAWRMLAMAIVLTQCAGGTLLIDEIDTGLHYTVMSDMWRLISYAANEFNVQVFATTHSYDCVHSLAVICDKEVTENSQVTIQRIDPRRRRSVPFSEAEIRVAAERRIEVR